MNLMRRTNAYLDATAPWHLAKAEARGEPGAAEQLDTALHGAATAVLALGSLLRAHLPAAAERILSIFPAGAAVRPGEPVDAADLQITLVSPVFPRVETDG
jgi:methionyl-tRNA synthetase